MTNKYFDQLLSLTDFIKDEKIRDFTQQVIFLTASENWDKPASRNHHPEDEREEFGNTIHTIRVFKITEVILSTTDLTDYQKDISRSASLLHDCCKYGMFGNMSYTAKDHADQAVQFIKDSGIEIPDLMILKAIEDHMGQWGLSKFYPQLTASDIIHLSDMIASQENILVKI